MPLAHRAFKDRLYGQFARIGKALGSASRLEFLELLAQSERTVDSLAAETGLSLANTSQHLQALRRASLVDTRKEGVFVYYRLSDPTVGELCTVLQRVARSRLAEMERLLGEHFGDRSTPEPVGMQDLLKRARSGSVTILDARSIREYEAGHIAGAISVPVDELQQRLRELPKDTEYVAYCRGPYCVYADRAVELLTASGRRARRLADGFPEWQRAGLPTTRGRQSGNLTERTRAAAPRPPHASRAPRHTK